MPSLQVRMIVMERGERLPLLIGEDGVPLFLPTKWLLTMRRPAHPAANTLQANCFALKFLYLWAEQRGIDVESRLLSGSFLRSHEIASLADAAALPLDAIGGKAAPLTATSKVVSLEKVRMRAPPSPQVVGTGNKANRLRTVAQYLEWLGQEGCGNLDLAAASSRKADLAAMLSNLNAKIPPAKGRNAVGSRESPPVETMDRMLAVLEPKCAENPWDDLGLQLRNRLLVHLFYGLGIRRGELLGIKIGDHIEWQRSRLLIARNADDPDDPRTEQPLAKTRDRFLPVKDGLMGMMQEYVTHIRSKIPGARRHSFLIVSHQTGRPLSHAALNKVFRNLRERVPDLPVDLSPHVLRHAWNDAFSRLIDAKNIDSAREAQMRSEMMGWSPTSGMAATYNKRKIREDADKLSLEHQKKLIPSE